MILNGVDLEGMRLASHPGSSQVILLPLLVVEGSLAGGLDTGLKAAVRLAEMVSGKYPLS